MSLEKSFNGGKPGGNGSGSSNGGGSGNNSDNSAIISLGNTSFGFNFDSEEGNSPNNSNNNSEGGDSDGSNRRRKEKAKPKSDVSTNSQGNRNSPRTDSTSRRGSVSSGSTPSAAVAVERLQSIANESSTTSSSGNEQFSLKRKMEENTDTDGGGYNSDDEGRSENGGSQNMPQEADEPKSSGAVGESGGQGGSRKKKKKKADQMKREERNAREKERSFRISRQINELRSLLSSGGVIVPKGTKSSVLTEAANYIRMLQQHQYRSEIDRHQLVQQIQMIGGGALGQQAATAVRHVAAQNGVWSLGNFGGMPPKSAMMYHQPGMNQTPDAASSGMTTPQQQASQDGSVLPNNIEEPDYRFVFNSCTVGMAIASMGGAFIDCNKLFSQLSSFSKQEVCSMTIFNFTAREDLQHAFDLISQMLSAPTDPNGNPATTSCVLRGSMKNRNDLGLSVSLIKGEDGVAKCFCVTLIRNPAHPFDTSRPIPATAELIQTPTSLDTTKPSGTDLDPTPRYTTG